MDALLCSVGATLAIYRATQTTKKKSRPKIYNSTSNNNSSQWCGHTILDAYENKDEKTRRGTLFLGSYDCAKQGMLLQLRQKKICRIVNCTQRCTSCHVNEEAFEYCLVNVVDDTTSQIHEHFDKATTFIEDNLCQGRNVLVHCRAGVSRSSTIVIAYLMRYCLISVSSSSSSSSSSSRLDDAYLWAKNKRPVVQPNSGFWQQLKTYERELNELDSSVVDSSTVTPAAVTQFRSSKKNVLPIDKDWATRSCSLFLLLISNLQNYTSFFPELSTIENIQQGDLKINCALTFLFSHGFHHDDKNVDWFLIMVKTIPTELNARDYVVQHYLTQQNPEDEENDDLSELASGELYVPFVLSNWKGEYQEEDVVKLIERLKCM